MITILSIDGGGIRGVIPASFLTEIEKRTNKPVCKLFDYIAGTSTGGIITAMLTVPDKIGKPKYSAEKVKSLYIELGQKVFQKNIFRKVVTLNGLIRPRYSALSLEKLLKEYLGESRLHTALTNIMLPAYDMKSCTPWFFKSTFALKNRTELFDPLLSQAVRATSAAPTYFRPLSMENHCFIDGGVFANDPALCVIAEAFKNSPKEKDFLVVSLGTGEHRKVYSCAESKKWGTVQWLLPLIGVVSNSSSATVNYQMKALVRPEQYYRFQVEIDEKATDMDNAGEENIEYLLKSAQKEINLHSKEIDRLCDKLLFAKRI